MDIPEEFLSGILDQERKNGLTAHYFLEKHRIRREVTSTALLKLVPLESPKKLIQKMERLETELVDEPVSQFKKKKKLWDFGKKLKTLSENIPPNLIFKKPKSKKKESRKKLLKSPPATERNNFRGSPFLTSKYATRQSSRQRSPKLIEKIEKTKTSKFLESATTRKNKTPKEAIAEMRKAVSKSLNQTASSRNKSAPVRSLYKTVASQFAKIAKTEKMRHTSSGRTKQSSRRKSRQRSLLKDKTDDSITKKKFYNLYKKTSPKRKNQQDIIKVNSVINNLRPGIFKDITNRQRSNPKLLNPANRKNAFFNKKSPQKQPLAKNLISKVREKIRQRSNSKKFEYSGTKTSTSRNSIMESFRQNSPRGTYKGQRSGRTSFLNSSKNSGRKIGRQDSSTKENRCDENNEYFGNYMRKHASKNRMAKKRSPSGSSGKKALETNHNHKNREIFEKFGVIRNNFLTN